MKDYVSFLLFKAGFCNLFNSVAVYTACGDACARAFDAKSGTLKRIFKGHEGAITCLTIVDDKLYTGSFDCTLKTWDLKNIQ